MDILLIALTVGLPLIKIVLFPARAMGRGGNWTLVGAVMIVGLMMALWFGIQSFSDTAGSATAAAGSGKASAAAAGISQSDIDALSKLFQ